VDLTSYAELAVRLVNSAAGVDSETDQLATKEAFAAFVGSYPHLRGTWNHLDMDALRMLRTELAAVFTAAAQRDHTTAAEKLNALLVLYPVRPVMVRHDRSRWHMHLDESGSVADRYAAGAVSGLALVAAESSLAHIGICAVPDCRCAYIDFGSGRTGRYCAKHGASKANVTAFRHHRRPAAGYSAAG
jgi:hypothetical protein